MLQLLLVAILHPSKWPQTKNWTVCLERFWSAFDLTWIISEFEESAVFNQCGQGLGENVLTWCCRKQKLCNCFTYVLHFHFWTKECDRKFCPKWFILLEETKWCPVKAPIHRVEILQFKVSEYLTCKTSRVTFSYNVFGSLT